MAGQLHTERTDEQNRLEGTADAGLTGGFDRPDDSGAAAEAASVRSQTQTGEVASHAPVNSSEPASVSPAGAGRCFSDLASLARGLHMMAAWLESRDDLSLGDGGAHVEISLHRLDEPQRNRWVVALGMHGENARFGEHEGCRWFTSRIHGVEVTVYMQ